MYLCILNREGEILVHRHIPAGPEPFLTTIAPDRTDLVVCVDCLLTGYGLAALGAGQGLPLVRGHALSMQAIHGGKAKNDKLAAPKIAVLRRGGMLPQADVYPEAMRATRALRRRRLPLTRKRAELLTHVQPSNWPYHRPALGQKIADQANRHGVAAP
jgi:hypothetical protein